MKLIINGSHSEKLSAALDEVQTRCSARTLTCSDVEYILEQAAGRLNIPKGAMKGTRLVYTGAEKFPNAYKGRPESTHFTAEHNGRFWVVTDIHRGACPDRRDDASLVLSESAREAVLKSFDGFRI